MLTVLILGALGFKYLVRKWETYTSNFGSVLTLARLTCHALVSNLSHSIMRRVLASPINYAPSRWKEALSLSERYFLCHSEESEYEGNHNIVMVSELKSKVPMEHVWKEAAKMLQKRHPLLQVRVNTQTLEFERPLVVPEIDVKTVEGDDWRAIVREELNTGFDLQKGPLFRIVWLKPGYLVTTCHHVICDGTAVYQLNKELLMLSKELLSPDSNQEASQLMHERMAKPLNVTELIPDAFKASKMGVMWIVLKLIARLSLKFFTNNWLLFPVRPLKSHKRVQDFYHYEFDEQKTQQMLAACKKFKGITITNLVHACASATVVDVLTSFDCYGNKSDFTPTSPVLVPMCVTVDLRRNGVDAIDSQAIRCYSSSIYTMLEVSPNEPVIDLAKKSRKTMAECLRNNQHLELQQVQFYTTKFIKIDNKFYVPVIYGNLGKWESINVQSDHFDAEAKGFFYSTPGSFNSLYLYTMTCGGKLNLSISYNSSLMYPQVVAKFFDVLIDKLNIAISQEMISSS